MPPIRYTIAELLDYMEGLKICDGESERRSLRSQIYRWCEDKTVPRYDRPQPSNLKVKLCSGVHWIEIDGQRLFTVKGRNEIIRLKRVAAQRRAKSQAAGRNA